MKSVAMLFFGLLLLGGCIGDDIIFDTVEETVRITARVDTLGVDETYVFSARFTNNIGSVEERPVNWYSSDPGILTIDQSGTAMGIAKGLATVTAEVILDNASAVRDSVPVAVDAETGSENNSDVRTGKIRTTSSYVLEGDFSLRREGDKLILDVEGNYKASDRLPGLYLYLTNNANTINNAFEIGMVTVFEGAHRYEISGVGLNDYDYLLYYCKPFSVKVGDGEISD
jgi:hypothetical protein